MSKHREQQKAKGEQELESMYAQKRDFNDGLFASETQSATRYYIGIDAGDKISAYAVYDTDEQRVLRFGIVTNDDLIDWITTEFGLDLENTPARVGIEMVHSYGMSVGQTVFDTCVQIGRLYESVSDFPDLYEGAMLIKRGHIKYHHTGHTSSKDKDVRDALIFKYGDKGTKANPDFFYGFSADMWQAFAVCAYMAEKDGVTPPKMQSLPKLSDILNGDD